MIERFWTDFELHHKDLPFIVRTVGYHSETCFVLPNGLPEYHILLTLSGNGECIRDGKIYSLSTDDFIFSSPNTPLHYYTVGTEPWDVAWITFSSRPTLSNILPIDPGFYKATGPELMNSIEAILALARTHKKETRRREASILLYQFLLTLPTYTSAYSTFMREELPSGLQRAYTYIHTHYAENITVTHLAEIAGMERTQFCRKFHKEYGLTPSKYISENRFHILQEYIKRAGNMPVSEIAKAFGFSDPSLLHRFLKQNHHHFTKMRKDLQNLASQGDWK